MSAAIIYKPRDEDLRSWHKLGEWVKRNCNTLTIADYEKGSEVCLWLRLCGLISALVYALVSLVEDEGFNAVGEPREYTVYQLWHHVPRDTKDQIRRAVAAIFMELSRFEETWILDLIAANAIVTRNANIRKGPGRALNDRFETMVINREVAELRREQAKMIARYREYCDELAKKGERPTKTERNDYKRQYAAQLKKIELAHAAETSIESTPPPASSSKKTSSKRKAVTAPPVESMPAPSKKAKKKASREISIPLDATPRKTKTKNATRSATTAKKIVNQAATKAVLGAINSKAVKDAVKARDAERDKTMSSLASEKKKTKAKAGKKKSPSPPPESNEEAEVSGDDDMGDLVEVLSESQDDEDAEDDEDDE